MEIEHFNYPEALKFVAKKYNIEIQGFPSSFKSRNNPFSLINFYQNINVQRNLYYFDVFFKEMLGIFIVLIRHFVYKSNTY